MSQTLVTGRGVTTSRAGSQPIVKTTCKDCCRTVLLVVVAGAKVAVDPEYIAVVPRKRNGEPERVVANRVHGEMCLRYQYENDKAKRRALFGLPPAKQVRGMKRGARTKGL